MICCAMQRWIVTEAIVQLHPSLELRAVQFIDGLLVTGDQTLNANQCPRAEPDLLHKRHHFGGMRGVMISEAFAGRNLNRARAQERFDFGVFLPSPFGIMNRCIADGGEAGDEFVAELVAMQVRRT
jgi:hypothetical protein